MANLVARLVGAFGSHLQLPDGQIQIHLIQSLNHHIPKP
jgi:hypothetical protein